MENQNKIQPKQQWNHLKWPILRHFNCYYPRWVSDEHFMLFSKAIFTLCLTNVTLSLVAHAEQLLLHFCVKFGKLCSERYQTANWHSLLQMPEDVRNLGPLWTHSTFPFENLNGELLKLFHGTQNIVFQIVSAVNINRAIPTLTKALVEGSGAQRFYKNWTWHTSQGMKYK